MIVVLITTRSLIMQLPSRYIAPLALCLLAISVKQAYGAGFAIIEHSASGLGNAYAGASAVANDTSTAFFNPAGLTKLEGTQFSVAGHIISPDNKFTDHGSSINPAFTGGTAVNGSLTGSTGVDNKVGFVPNLYYTRAMNERMTFGFSLTAPFGNETDYDDDWVGRYHALNSSIAAINLNPAIGYKINDKWSIGGGINVQYIKAELSSAIDSSAVCLGSLSAIVEGGGSAQTCNSLGLSSPNNVDTDSKVEYDADNWGFGFNVGVMYDMNKRTRLGASYRSAIDHDAEGDADFTLTPALDRLFASSIQLQDSAVTATVGLPDTASLSAAHYVSPKLQLLADATWTGWSSFDELRIEYDNGQNDAVTPQNWEDVWRYSIGVNYHMNDRLTLRGGLAFDEEAIPTAADRTPRTPGNDRTWYAFGMGYELTKNTSFDLGYTYIAVKDGDLANVNSSGHTLNGTSEADVSIFSAQYNWRF